MKEEIKKDPWGGEFWTRGYYVGTVGEHGDEEIISRYVKNQGRNPEEYKKIHENKQRLSQNFSFWESNFEIRSFVRLKA